MAASPKNAYVYVLGTPGGPCKVGWSADPDRRSKYGKWLAGQPDVLHRAPISNGFALYAERYAHWLLRDHHYRNEWFNVEPEVAINAANKAVAIDFHRNGLIPTMRDLHSIARFPKGTMDRINEVLDAEHKEKRSSFYREAVERELTRREREKAKKR